MDYELIFILNEMFMFMTCGHNHPVWEHTYIRVRHGHSYQTSPTSNVLVRLYLDHLPGSEFWSHQWNLTNHSDALSLMCSVFIGIIFDVCIEFFLLLYIMLYKLSTIRDQFLSVRAYFHMSLSAFQPPRATTPLSSSFHMGCDEWECWPQIFTPVNHKRTSRGREQITGAPKGARLW